MKRAIILLMMGWTVFASTATAGLIAHYPLDGDANDAAGSSNLTVTGTITYDGADLQVGTSSGVFNGSSFGSVGMPDLTSQTYAFWVYPTANGFPLSRDGSSRFEVRLLSGEILIYLNSTATIDTRGTATLDVPLNQWTHVAITLDETAGEVSLYINKILWETVATSRSISGEPLFVGARAYSGGSSPFLGKIDDVRVYDTVLSSSEVAQLPPIATGNTAPQIEIAETGVFVEPGVETSLPDATVMDDDFPGNPVSAITWSVTDQPTGSTVTFDATTNNTVTLSDAGNYTLTASVNDGEFTNDVSLLLVGRSPGGALQNHWEFETNLTDSISGIEGQAVTNSYVDSFYPEYGQALEFDGSTNRVIDCGPFGGATAGSLTYAVWLKPSVIANQEVITKYSTTENSAGLRISLRSDSSIRFFVGSGSSIYALAPANSYAVDEWVHLACTIDLANDLVTAYVNGESVASRDLAGKTPGILDSDASLFLGSYYNLQYRYVGLMDDVRVYDKVLDAGEVADLVPATDPTLSVLPSVELDMFLDLPATSTTGMVSVSFLPGPSGTNVQITAVNVVDQQHAGAFSSVDFSSPLVLANQAPSNETLSIEFDGSVAGLLSGYGTSTGMVEIVWEELGGDTYTNTLPVVATVTAESMMAPIAVYDFENNLDNTGASAGLDLASSGSSAVAYDVDATNGSYAGSFDGAAWGTVDLPNLRRQTYAFWVKPATTSGYIVSSGQDAAERFEFRIVDQELLIYVGNSLKTDTRDTPEVLNLPANVWTHIAFTLDEGAQVFNSYINGGFYNTDTTGNKIGDGLDPTFFIGARSYNDGTNPFAGLMDNFRVYNRVLDAGEIAAVMAGTAPVGDIALGGLVDGKLVLSWDTSYGQTYNIETNGNLSFPSGWGIFDTIVGDGYPVSITNTPVEAQLFYKVTSPE